MKFQFSFLYNLLLVAFLLNITNLLAQCEEPLTIDFVQPYLASPCTDEVYAFTYNNEAYIYITSTPSCIAADAPNILYNCDTDATCQVFGFTPPSAQCNATLLQNIDPLLTAENVIYTGNTTVRDCGNPLFMQWLSPLLQLNCTDGVYSFQHLGTDYLYRSTACEYVDDPNYLYNCATAEICYVQGRTLPELQCNLATFPLDDYLTRENLIWSTPLLDLVKDFPWLTSKLDIKGCTDNVVSRYDVPGATYVIVGKDNANKMYNAAGDLYCTDRDNLNCLDAYSLEKPNSEWACNAREPGNTCEAIDADNLPAWLTEYISGLSCECGGEILQYCYNNVTYISYEANAPFCADYAGFIFSEDGAQICQNGGFTGGDCFTILPNFFEEAELVNDLWACEDCSQFAFTEAYLDCSNCCEDLIIFSINGTITNYTVTNVTTGEQVVNGDPVGDIGPVNFIELIATSTNGCSTSVSIPYGSLCCDVAPVCELSDVYYNCEEGLQIEAVSTSGEPQQDICYELAVFQDQFGNSYQTGDFFPTNGTYNLTLTAETGVYPICGTFEIEVQCEKNCNEFTFTEAYLGCSDCCDDVIYFSINDIITNYEVFNTFTGEQVFNGDPIGAIGPSGNIELTATSILGCITSVSIPFYPFCCEVPPICSVDNVYYDCEAGLQIEASSTFGDPLEDFYPCAESAIFQDQFGNTYQTGSIISSDGVYELILNGGGSISPACGNFELLVDCGNSNPCQLDAGEIITEPSFCRFGPGAFLQADYANPSGPDDNEYVFVQVNDDDSFVVLSGYYEFPKEGCYYGIHYRSSCDVPNFNAATFSEILEADANYAITGCFEFIINDTPLYSITTAPYCNGEGLFSVGVTVTRGSGNYYIGQDYTGTDIYGKEGENFITFQSGMDHKLFPADVVTGCNSDIVLAVIDPGCGTFESPCELPADSGPCEALIPRYYYNSEEGDCLEFIYGGCEGNANNFETYQLCIESCANNNTNCTDPFELEFVQNAINYPNCTEGVYAFNYQNEDYVFVQSLCQYIDDSSILYNCNSGETCYVGGDFNYSRECEDFYVEIAYLVNDENSIWSRPCNYEFTGEVKYIPVNGCYNYKIELENGIKLEPITVQNDFTFSEGQIVEFSYNTIQPGVSFCESDSLVNIICIREIEGLGDPLETEIVQNALNSNCTGNIYAFNYQNEDYIYISTLCEYIDASNTLYNQNTGDICSIDGIALPDPVCDDIYEQIEPLINDENLIWSLPCNYEHIGIVKNDPQNGCGYYIALDNGTNIEPVSNDTGFALSAGQTVELSYNVLQPISTCEAGFYVSIICIREIDEGCICTADYDPVCGVDGSTYSNACAAECEGVEIAYQGECDLPCPDPLCDSTGELVCGVDGITYENYCLADCLGIEIAYYGECDKTPNNEVFESFPWLLNLVDPVFCASGLSVEVYMSGIFNFVFVKYPEAPGTLYFQDGTYYCEDVRDFSCIAAYNLTDLVASWTCNTEPTTAIQAEFNNLVCNNDGTFSIDVTATGSFSGSYGIYGQKQDGGAPAFFNFIEGETFVFTGNNTDVQNDIYTIFVYDLYLADVAATPFEINIEECNEDGESNPAIFDEYPWLSSIINPTNCSNGSKVTEYDLGPYAFIFIETPAGTTMYYQDGTYYCADRSNFSCKEVYGLTTITNSWSCSDVPPANNCLIEDPLALPWLQTLIENFGADECGLKEVKIFNYEGDDYIYTLSYPIYPGCPTDTGGSSIYDCVGNNVCNFGYFMYNPEPCDDGLVAQSNGDLIWEYTSNVDDGLLIKYPWMYDLFNPLNCAGITVQEYDNGAFAFITIEDGNGLHLYFEDGSLFCADRENFSCIEAYDLVDVTATWSCSFSNRATNDQIDNKLAAAAEEIIKIYPNPNNGIFTIDLTDISSKIQKIEIYDIAGKQHHLPIDLNDASTALKLNAENLNSGNYIVTVLTENKLHTETVIIH